MVKHPNVILIVLDTLRRDVLSIYGGATRTPFLTALAAESVVYPDCIAPSPWTVPSHASMLVGGYPSEHGVHEEYDRKGRAILEKMRNKSTLAQELRLLGYHTVGYSSNPNIGPSTGFDSGFDSFTFVDPLQHTPSENALISDTAKLGGTKMQIALSMIAHGRLGDLFKSYSAYRGMKRRKEVLGYPRAKGGKSLVQAVVNSSYEQPLFLFLNFMEMHEPYSKGEPDPRYVHFGLRRVNGNTIKRGYNSAAEELDSAIGPLITFFKANGAFKDTLFVVTSDHGQSLTERGFFGHGIFLHDELVRVPLIVKYPFIEKPPVQKGYQTLVDMRSFILGVASGGAVQSGYPCRQTVFSESFGIAYNMPFLDKVEPSLAASFRARYDVKRTCVFHEDFKVVLRPEDGALEEFSANAQAVKGEEHQNTLRKMEEMARSKERSV